MLHRKLSYISVKTLIKTKFLPYFCTGRKLRPLGVGIEVPGNIPVGGVLDLRFVYTGYVAWHRNATHPV